MTRLKESDLDLHKARYRILRAFGCGYPRACGNIVCGSPGMVGNGQDMKTNTIIKSPRQAMLEKMG